MTAHAYLLIHRSHSLRLSRRLSLSLLVCTLVCTFLPSARANSSSAQPTPSRKPNILWLTCEDMGPHIGPYGDKYATTPHLDQFARRSFKYLHAWSNAPVCAPARTTIISGLYPPSTGSEHMRSNARLPAGFKMYPQYLREHGYYCTNNSKEDYNLTKPGPVWDDSSNKAHWKNRGKDQPFFAIFNDTVTHESQIRKRPHKAVHDPRQVRLPAYHPDTPELRQDWAQYYDNITTMDNEVGRRLQELADAGLMDDTIIFFYSDHGSGMPRNKRSACNSGLHVPLLIFIPEKYKELRPADYQAGGATDRLVSFVDLAPTLLSLVGLQPPSHFQGQAFLGPCAAPPQPYVFGFRGRMDERYDLVRSCRDQRYVYVRNYMPHRPHGQHNDYMFVTPSTRAWYQLYREEKLTAVQAAFWQPKAPEELYDLQTDPEEVTNLASSPAHQEILARLRTAHQEWAARIRDVDLLPEAEMHARSAGSTFYEVGHDDSKYPFAAVLHTANLASSQKPGVLSELKQAAQHADSGVRYWALMGLLMRGKDVVTAEQELLQKALTDPAPSVRIPAAEALGKWGQPAQVERAVALLVELADTRRHPLYVSVQALNALDELDDKAAPHVKTLKTISSEFKSQDPRTSAYIGRLVEKILADLK